MIDNLQYRATNQRKQMTKTKQMNIVYAEIDEVAKECFIVYAALGGGQFLYHNGPKDYAYFCYDEALNMAQDFNKAKVIDPEHWNDGSFCDMTARDMEDGFYAGNH